MEGNPVSMLENGKPVDVVRVTTPDGGNAFQHLDGSPVTGTLTGVPPIPGSTEDRVRQALALEAQKRKRPLTAQETFDITTTISKPPPADPTAKIGPALQLANSLKSHPSYVKMLDISSGFGAVKAGINQKNGTGDIAIINALQRMIDPGVSVRDSDVVLLQGAQPFIEKLRAAKSSFTTGSKFTDETRAEILKLASALMAARAAGFNESVGAQYKSIAQEYGIPYQLIGSDFEVPTEGQPIRRPSRTQP